MGAGWGTGPDKGPQPGAGREAWNPRAGGVLRGVGKEAVAESPQAYSLYFEDDSAAADEAHVDAARRQRAPSGRD